MKNKIKQNIIIFIIVILGIALGTFFIFFALKDEKEIYSTKNNMLAVWWWNDALDTDVYLPYAQENNVTDIFYCTNNFSDETENFIVEANKLNMDVFLLDGDYRWLEDSSSLYNMMQEYVNYQLNNPFARFKGVHLDIEPHQHPDFDLRRGELILSLIQLAYNLKVDFPNILFEYDIPFWLDDEIEFNGETKPAYAHMIDIADRITLMSYRDSADGIYSVAEDEIEYSQLIGKTLVLGVETGEEEDIVTFYEEGKEYMNTELNELRTLISKDFGLSIHHIYSWYNLE